MTEAKSAYDATVHLTKSYLGKCDLLISRLESGFPAVKVTAEDCFALWSKLGDLRRGVWSQLSASERADLDSKSGQLEARLKAMLIEHRQELLDCVESGMSKALSEAEHSRKEVEHFLKKGRISTTLTSAELNAGLFYWRDELGFALLLAKELGLEISPKVRNRIERLDGEMRKVLPEALRIYREAEDDPTPYPERFPEPFWWRQLR